MPTRRRILIGFSGLTLATLIGCEENQRTAARLPVPIVDGDECHLCGMIINNFPGPKGQTYVFQGGDEPFKFCSTRDLFAYVSMPEAQSIVREIYVHDIEATTWDKPAFEAFIDGRAAWYVADQPLRGAMGPTLASFREQAAAERFIEQHGGRLLTFADIDVDLITGLG